MMESEIPPALDLQDEMVIEPGRTYALIGQNRAGKSTLNNLLCKLYAPDGGNITLDGIPYSEISRTSLRSIITYVSQRPFIFPGSIRDNILVGNPDASEEEVEAAAEAAGVFAFAEAAGLSWYRSPRSPYFDNNYDLYRNGSRDNLRDLDRVDEEDEEDGDNRDDENSEEDYDSDDEYSLSSASKLKSSGNSSSKLDVLEKAIEKEAKIKLAIEKEMKNDKVLRHEADELKELDKEDARANGDQNYGGSSGSDDLDKSANDRFKSAVKGVILHKDFNVVFAADKKSKHKLKKKGKKHVLLPPASPLALSDGPENSPKPTDNTTNTSNDTSPNSLRRNNSSIQLHKSSSTSNLRRNYSTTMLHRSGSIGSNLSFKKSSLTSQNSSPNLLISNNSNSIPNPNGMVSSTCHYALNLSDCSPPKEPGWIGSFFAPTLPYAFPRAYPGDSDDEEEVPVRPPPVVPHKSGPHSSHPILDQEIEARGQNISGGFAQSIALARIFVRHETKILILDEAMSQMDAYKKREIIYPKLFEWSKKNSIALIIVTHDLHSIQDVDHVFVLDQGVLVHQGTHQELLDQKAEVYMRLLGV